MKKVFTRVRLAVFAVIMGTGVGYAVSGPMDQYNYCLLDCGARYNMCMLQHQSNCEQLRASCTAACRFSPLNTPIN